jgi:hypothetical protein
MLDAGTNFNFDYDPTDLDQFIHAMEKSMKEQECEPYHYYCSQLDFLNDCQDEKFPLSPLAKAKRTVVRLLHQAARNDHIRARII